MKVIFVCLLAASCHALSFTDKFTAEDAVRLAKQLTLAEIESVKSQLQLPAEEKREITGPNGEVVVDPNEHFCCAQQHIQDKNWNTKDQTKIVSEYRRITFKHKTGYTKCGNLGWRRCSLYKEAYAQQLFTYTQVVEIEDVKFCPDQHITCCHGYTEVADGGCLRLDDLKENPKLADSLCRLAKLGLLKTHEKPKNCPSDG